MCAGLSRRTSRARMRCAVNGKGSADVSHYFELLVSRRSRSPLDDSSSKKSGGPRRGGDAGTAGFVTMDERPGRDPRASMVRPEDATPGNRGTLPRANEEALAGTGTAMLRRCHTDVTFGGEKAHDEDTTRGF